MNDRFNSSNEDEFEEVESPFARSSDRVQSREKLRTRKNVFNRPFATESTVAPTYFEAPPTRKALGPVDQTELIHKRKSTLKETEIEYLDDDSQAEEEVEKKVTRTVSTRKKEKTKGNVLQKVGWSLASILILRLIFMDRGVWDYFTTESEIKDKKQELRSIQTENREIQAEISKIQLDKNYQKLLAKEHLGVIAADEFLILFAGESSDSRISENEI